MKTIDEFEKELDMSLESLASEEYSEESFGAVIGIITGTLLAAAFINDKVKSAKAKKYYEDNKEQFDEVTSDSQEILKKLIKQIETKYSRNKLKELIKKSIPKNSTINMKFIDKYANYNVEPSLVPFGEDEKKNIKVIKRTLKKPNNSIIVTIDFLCIEVPLGYSSNAPEEQNEQQQLASEFENFITELKRNLDKETKSAKITVKKPYEVYHDFTLMGVEDNNLGWFNASLHFVIPMKELIEKQNH